MKILVINTGSSTHKLSLFDGENEEPVWKGIVDWGEQELGCVLTANNHLGQTLNRSFPLQDSELALETLIHSLWEGPVKVINTPQEIDKVGHRVVQGGSQLIEPVLITDEVKEEIRQLIPLAPLHNPANLKGIELLQKILPGIPQIAVFDTAFHRTISEVVRTYPIPYKWKEKGIQRYGFHGISHHYCAERIQELTQRNDLRLINCHLGNGASLCAIKHGKSVNTTMGLTPLEGLMMGTRCGSIDPGLLLYLEREEGFTPNQLDHLLNFESGLKGICGTSDMREVVASKEANAVLAFEMFVDRLKCYIGALAASLGGVDVLCFTAGIGEHSWEVRKAACEGLGFLGIELDDEKNRNCHPDVDIASDRSKVKIYVVETREEWMIAQACRSFT